MDLPNGVCPSPTTGGAPLIFTSALAYFAASQCLITEDWPPDADVTNFSYFDFIVIGAGSAGSVVANRLTEVEKWNVLLIEAGENPPEESIIPKLSSTMYKTRYDWDYETQPQENRDAATVRESVFWPRGKMLGGSSSMNVMIYFRGNTQDYQKWYEQGNKEWHPDTVAKYFRKAESFQDAEKLKDPNIAYYYGKSGPLVINKFNNSIPYITDGVLEAWDEIGIRNVPDLNVANVMGSGYFTGTASDGERNSGATAYLNPIQKRPNLKIMKRSLVTKILINDQTNSAFGVQVRRNNETLTFYANKEVIVSGGTINTPQILMLSGIGPKKHLQSLNITSYLDLPAVGQNLQDHIIVPVTIYGDENHFDDFATQQFDAIKYLYNRTGYLAEPLAADIMAFYSLYPFASYPSFQNHIIIFPKKSLAVPLLLSNYKLPVIASITKLSSQYAIFYFAFNLLHPYSRGNITLKSSDPEDKPLIYANYFKDPMDLRDTVAGIKYLTRIVKTKYFKSINGFLGRIDWPECNKYELDSYEYWECISLNLVVTIYHPVGTAKMGVDPFTSVVDSRLRVHGVKGLRVVDASVMPTITSSNTNGPTFMIAERASDLIKEDHGIYIKQDYFSHFVESYN